MKEMIKNTAIMLVITVVAGLILGLIYQVTKEPIAEQEAGKKREACQEVFQDAAAFEAVEVETVDEAAWNEEGYGQESIDEVMRASDASGNLLGYVITVTTKEGYGGDIQFTIGVRTDGTVNGMSILSISETAGLGMRAEEVLKPQFAGRHAEKFAYTKNGAASEEQIDAISGATITTNAVTNGVNAGLYYFRTALGGGSADE